MTSTSDSSRWDEAVEQRLPQSSRPDVQEGRYEALYELLARLAARGSLSAALNEVLMASLEVVGADAGYIRLFDPRDVEPITNPYPFVVHKGISDNYVDYFSALSEPVDQNARQAVFNGKRVIIEDMFTHPSFSAHREVVLAEGYRSMQATPLMSRNASRSVGTICTHFLEVYTPPLGALETLDLYAELAATTIEHHQQGAELARRDSILTTVAEEQRQVLLRIQERVEAIEHSALSLEPEHVRLLAHGISDDIQHTIATLGAAEIIPQEGPNISPEARSHPYGLSSREIEVVVNVWRGLSDKQIGVRMAISRFTVAKHLGAAMRKMNVETRTQASVLIEREAIYRAAGEA